MIFNGTSTGNTSIEVLNKQLANNTVLWTKLHNFHWYVKGPNSSHYTKFEELYDATGQYVDDLAERILTIGGEPVAKLTEAKNQALKKANTALMQNKW